MHTDAVRKSIGAGVAPDNPGPVMRCKLTITSDSMPVIGLYQGQNGAPIL